MTLFTDEAAVYGALGKLFSDVIADEGTVGALVRTNTILQLQLREPRSTVTIAVRQGQQPLIYFGQTTRRPEVFLQMTAETAHGWLSGEINPTVAFNDNRIKSRGPSAQVLAILAWAKVLTPRYKIILEENGGELPPPLAPPEPKPKADEPKADEPTAEEPKADEPKAEEPKPEVETPAPMDDAAPAQDAPEPEAAAPEPEPELEAAEPEPEAAAPTEGAAVPDATVADPAPADAVPTPAQGPAQPVEEAAAVTSEPPPVQESAELPSEPTVDPAPEDEAPRT